MFGCLCLEVAPRQTANVGLAALNSLNPLSLASLGEALLFSATESDRLWLGNFN